MEKVKVLVVGCGHMGASYSMAYHHIDDFEIVGIVNRSVDKGEKLAELLGGARNSSMISSIAR